MLREEFDEVINELIDSYGQNKYPPRSVDKLWFAIKFISQKEFQHAVDQIVEDGYGYPNTMKIRKALSASIQRHKTNEKKKKIDSFISSGDGCEKCGNTGFVTAFLKENPFAEYAFKCPFCDVAELMSISSDFVTWDNGKTDKFIPVSMTHFSAGMEAVKKLREKYLSEFQKTNVIFETS